MVEQVQLPRRHLSLLLSSYLCRWHVAGRKGRESLLSLCYSCIISRNQIHGPVRPGRRSRMSGSYFWISNELGDDEVRGRYCRGTRHAWEVIGYMLVQGVSPCADHSHPIPKDTFVPSHPIPCAFFLLVLNLQSLTVAQHYRHAWRYRSRCLVSYTTFPNLAQWSSIIWQTCRPTIVSVCLNVEASAHCISSRLYRLF